MSGEDRREKSKYVVWLGLTMCGWPRQPLVYYGNGWEQAVATGNMTTELSP